MAMQDDPLKSMPAGSRIAPAYLNVSLKKPGKVPVTVEDWEYFDGSLLAIGFMEDDFVLHVEGTAVMIGVGLAVSAKHVFTDRLADVRAGDQGIVGLGLTRDGRSVMWVVQTLISLDDNGDLVMLSLRLVSEVPAGAMFSCLPLTARTPQIGEPLTIVGFRFDEPDEAVDRTSCRGIDIAGDMYIARGKVTQLYWPMRDRVLAPYPAIDVACGSHGGMSGGAVLDHHGAVIGVVSRGFKASDGQGPTLVAWITDLFRWTITPTWPPGMYPPNTQLARMPCIQYLGQKFITLNEDSVEVSICVEEECRRT